MQMRYGGRFIKGVCAVSAAALIGVTGASAATPKAIYGDVADNGKLDRTYSRADLESALKNASVQGYGGPMVNVAYKPLVQRALGAQARVANARVSNAPPVRRTLPFTGLDLALLGIGGAALLAIGAGVRRIGRDRA